MVVFAHVISSETLHDWLVVCYNSKRDEVHEVECSAHTQEQACEEALEVFRSFGNIKEEWEVINVKRCDI